VLSAEYRVSDTVFSTQHSALVRGGVSSFVGHMPARPPVNT